MAGWAARSGSRGWSRFRGVVGVGWVQVKRVQVWPVRCGQLVGLIRTHARGVLLRCDAHHAEGNAVSCRCRLDLVCVSCTCGSSHLVVIMLCVTQDVGEHTQLQG